MPRGSLRGYLGHGCFPLIFGNSTSLDKGGLSINLASMTLRRRRLLVQSVQLLYMRLTL